MRSTTKAKLDKIEYGDFRNAGSDHHGSATYFVFETYKPATKYIRK